MSGLTQYLAADGASRKFDMVDGGSYDGDKAGKSMLFSLSRVTFRLGISTPKQDYTDKALVSPSAELSSNSSDRELPRDMFRFKPSRIALVGILSNSSYHVVAAAADVLTLTHGDNRVRGRKTSPNNCGMD